ncbi:XtrA/YqaO family protein [Bacillus paralicheniformis]|uniref:XtrA/YqaO family protein n=1 Tax=Bacillus paralicheniformis TaxID=1648923 RepID=UPI001C21679D|nr:XtrA/YqaO family protein [Bacillus paralicheniformis]
MNSPKEINVNQDLSKKIQDGKVTVIVLDGLNGKAYEAQAPEHGRTIIETFKGDFSRINLESSHKFN